MVYLAKVSELSSDDILAKKIFNSTGQVLLPKGIKMKESYINKLKNLGINHVYVKDKMLNNNDKATVYEMAVIPEKIKEEAVTIANSCVEKIKSGVKDLKQEEDQDINEVINIIKEIIEGMNDDYELLTNLKDVRMLEDELFFHLTNVTVLSLMTAKKLGYNKERLKELGVGAFLHDIGKAKVPAKILNKPGKLTEKEFEQVKKHTIYGYEILSSQDSISDKAARIAYQHHERCDGSGYPKGLTKRFIDRNSRIVAIADVFDAMLNDRVYREGLKAKEVVEYLYTTFTQNKLDRDILEVFFQMVNPYPLGARVKLSIGCEAVVVKINQDAKLRPVVKISNFRGLDRDIEIDLSQKLDIDIVNVM